MEFAAILRDLEPFFQIPLQPDKNNSCLIKYDSGLSLQMELDRRDNLLVAVRLGAIPASRYRDNVFREALKSNFLYPPSEGIFGYSVKSGQLYFSITIDNQSFSLEKATNKLTPFIEKSKKWFEALSRGEMPPSETVSGADRGLFGLMR